jgi:glycosyltransferase involved in cell wall biosynthesis
LLNPIGGIGGAERILLAVARQVRRQQPGLALAAVLLGDGPLVEALEKLGVDVRVLPLSTAAAELGDTQLRGRSRLQRLAALAQSGLSAGPDMLRFSRKLRLLLQDLRPGLIHSNGLKTHLLSAIAGPANVPLLWHVHDFYSQRPLMANGLRELAGKAAGAIAISNAVKADVAEVFPGLPVSLIYNAIDTERFSPGPGDPSKLDELASLAPAPADTLRIGLVATYANWKGHDVFLKAAARILREANARFYIVGGPIYSTLGSQFSREELQALAHSLGIADRVGFVPFQADPVNIYRSLDVVVHASTRPEPFGLTIAEAMACGRATVVSEAGGARELFTDNVDALGHVPGDIVSLSAALTALIESPARRRELGDQARRTALDRFSEDRFGREILAVYARHLDFASLTKLRREPGPRVLAVPSPSRGMAPVELPRRVVYFNPIGGLGGAEQSLLRILAMMKRFAPSVECHLLAGSDGPLLEKAAALGVKVERFPLAEPIAQLGESGLRGPGYQHSRMRFLTSLPRVSLEVTRTTHWLNDWIDEHQPDLIHSNGLKTHLLTALVKPRHTPLLWHVRDFLSNRPLMRWNLRWLAPRATMAVANSEAVAADARRVFGRLPVETFYNTVDTSHFNAAPCRPERLDELAGLPSTPPDVIRIGLVATYANWKGHDVLLQAAARIPRGIPFRVYLIGEPIYSTPGSQFTHGDLEALAARLGIRDRVGFIPFQNDTAGIYRKLDIVVHASSRPEPFGLTIAEAMACGRSVIVSAGGGARELFTDGVDALGHEPGDVESLLRALLHLIGDPDRRRRLGEAARRTAETRFAEEPFARDLLALYSQCLTMARK